MELPKAATGLPTVERPIPLWLVPREFVLMIPFVLTIFAAWLGGLWRRRSLEAEAGYAELREPDF